MLYESWYEEAACRKSKLDFFAERVTKAVIETCESCPVKEKCLDYAARNELYGFWGGMNERQREAYRRKNRIRLVIPSSGFIVYGNKPKPEVPIIHGTEQGYQQERKRNLGTCDECRNAHRDRMNAYRKTKAESNA